MYVASAEDNDMLAFFLIIFFNRDYVRSRESFSQVSQKVKDHLNSIQMWSPFGHAGHCPHFCKRITSTQHTTRSHRMLEHTCVGSSCI